LLRDQSINLTERLRRTLSPTYGARVNAAEALDDLCETDAVVLHGSDLALFNGHPAGLSKRRAAGRLGTALWEVFPGHVALLDRDGVIVSVNRAWREFALETGGNPTAGLGRSYLDVCAASAHGEPQAREAADLICDALEGRESERSLSYRCSDRWFSMQAIPIPGRHSGALVVHSDITTARVRESEWQHRALHDPLTDLPNRALLVDRLQHAVSVAARDPRSLAVLFVDLVAFKSINDRLGHAAGDQALCEASRRMAESLRASDTIGRWGGDEFLVIAERLGPDTTGEDLAGRIRASLRSPMAIDGMEVSVQARVGVAHLEQHSDADRLVRAADDALLRVRDESSRIHADGIRPGTPIDGDTAPDIASDIASESDTVEPTRAVPGA
jgi:diguanylate cyclase (GGDEF)-like protein